MHIWTFSIVYLRYLKFRGSLLCISKIQVCFVCHTYLCKQQNVFNVQLFSCYFTVIDYTDMLYYITWTLWCKKTLFPSNRTRFVSNTDQRKALRSGVLFWTMGHLLRECFRGGRWANLLCLHVPQVTVASTSSAGCLWTADRYRTPPDRRSSNSLTAERDPATSPGFCRWPWSPSTNFIGASGIIILS